MLRNSSWRLDETNLANFGSELEREHRKEQGSLEEAWNYEDSPVGKEIGLWIWRVQNFSLVTVPEKQYGQFYQGISLIFIMLYWTTKKENSDGLIHHIHFWLVLDTLATQHREVQRRESRLFKSYFKALRYLQGGFASGFNHVEEEEIPKRLLRVHRPSELEGTRTQNAVVISEVPLSHESLRSKAVFILDTGDKIYQWQGSDEGEVVDGDEDEEEEEAKELEENSVKKLFVLRKSHASLGLKLKFELVAEDKITKDMFDTNHVYIFDVGHQVYAWFGREAGRRERRAGLQYAQDYVKDIERSAFTPICKIVEGGEDELFESSLEGWQGW
ncbi:hypothetical protein BDB00DRAFT_884323 [Zychaea mexicana]|uniref:uncharacterized protein n=1 Tax=Zychaea mexicana TaxID=64656 RepID=UPI0022FE07C9|nr:uncharacterized protein BDB00DRAFT_884323 [Zychaea mexicana]KAI9489983.1 hypothetical protein BDB00DRAFT_884323 [Zychaea mexicana]